MILSKKFWGSLENREFKSKFNVGTFFRFLNIGEVKGYFYLETIIKKGFEIIILSITNAFFIGIHRKNRLLVSFEFNLKRNKENISYYQNYLINNRDLRDIVEFIDTELKQMDIYLKHNRLKRGRIPFQKPIKILLCTILWAKYTEQDNSIEFENLLSFISEDLCLDPLSVALYGMKSPDLDIASEANKIYKLLYEKRLEITKQWQRLKKERYELSAMEVITAIAKKKKISPATVASSARYSTDRIIRLNAIRVYGEIQEKKHNITPDLLKLRKEYPQLTSIKIIKKLAKLKKLNPSTIAALCRYSTDMETRIESTALYLNLMMERHKIIERWLAIRADPFEKAPIIAKELKIKPISVLFYAILSEEKIVQDECLLAYKTLLLKNRKIKNKSSKNEMKIEDRFSNLVNSRNIGINL